VKSNELLDPLIPGSDLVVQGLEDIKDGRITAYSLLLQVAAPRLKNLNIDVPVLAGIKSPEQEPYEHQLYEFIKEAGGYSWYNSLCGRIASFASALEARRAFRQ
jgi:hypothetical protein